MLYVLLLLATVISDQWLKYWIINHLELGESMPFIPHILQLERLHNYGAAFSSLTGKTAFLLGMTVVLLLVLAVLLARRVVRHPLGVIACVLILGGGIGNMIDRIGRGFVVDFIDVTCIDFYVFNIADSFVCVGCGLMILWLILDEAAQRKAKLSAAETTSEESTHEK